MDDDMHTKHPHWAIRNAYHTITWNNGLTKINIALRDNWLDIYYFPDQTRDEPNIRLFVELRENSVKFTDLIGNGTGTGYQCKYIGTVLVNLAIQMLKLIYKEKHESIIVTGETCPDRTAQEPSYTTDIARRAHFWQRFGFVLENPTEAVSPFRSNLANLQIVDRGVVGDISTLLSVNSFWRNYHQPKLYPQDMVLIQQVDTDSYHRIKQGKSRNEIQAIQDSLDKNRLNLFYFFCISAYLTQLYFFYDLPVKWLLTVALGFYFSSVFIAHRYTEKLNAIFPAFYDLKKWNELRQEARMHWQVIIDTEKQRPGLLKRFYQALLSSNSIQRNPILDDSSNKPEYSNMDQRDLCIEWYPLIEKFKNQFNVLNKVGRQHADSKYIDFLFGATYCNGMSISQFNDFATQLDDQFEYHFNRLVKLLPDNRVTITGGTFSELTGMNKLSNIARVELYTSGNINSDYVRIHFRLFILEGIVDFQCDWSVYKETRRQESLVVLSQLVKQNLLVKTFIVDGENYIKVPEDPDGLLYSFLDLGKCFCVEPDEFKAYTKLLEGWEIKKVCPTH
jgi:hypothetical protein